MMKLKRFDEGIWYDYFDGVRLKVKPLNRKDVLDFRAKVKHKLSIDVAGEQKIIDDFNEADFIWAIFKNSLEDWTGIFTDDAGTKARHEDIFNDDNLREFIFQKANDSYKKMEESVGVELKNSEPSQSGS
jgi:hypothetical protein